MSALQCQKCNYEFEKEKIPMRCPYCATEGSVVPYKTAQDWLDDVEF